MIKRASLEHIRPMIGIYNQAIEDQVYANCDVPVIDTAKFEHQYFSDTHKYICLTSVLDDGEVRGWGALKRFSARPLDDGIAEVAVYIERSSRASGLGIYLLRRLIKHARSVNLDSLVAIVLGHNVQSIRGSMSCGFTEQVRFPSIATMYQESEDIVWMQKTLTKGE